MDAAEDTSPINVVVKAGAQAHSVAFKPSWTLDEFKTAVEAATGVPVSDQSLSVNKIDLRFYQGPLDRMMRATTGSGINLSRSGDELRSTGNSVLNYRPMRSNASCGAMEKAMKTSGGSFASRTSRHGRMNASMPSLHGPSKDAERAGGLRAHYQAMEMKKNRERQKAFDRPVHLRPNPSNPLDNGCKPNFTSEQMRALSLPVQMATNPKWSSDLHKINNKIGLRLEWESKMAASMTGSMLPELKHMPPKTYVDSPAPPFFVPGEAHIGRRG